MNEHDNDGKNKPLKIVFAQGCFDDFEGTQEELDAIIAQLTELAQSGELLENSTFIEDLEEIDDEVLDLLPMLSTGNIRH
jgi:hypothetical protein